ncbi:MAG: 2-oxoglutarate oxidoreductase subunit KorB [Candidatus Anoxychlamydiales bacterium]|nr:2-oxoglutarate oxidoreductase subunit KorB [Candidatus Anoxychlamydiales bacterium]NGX35473.1 2-oxoglutarate oxidoreductase subunit KorB [Candidatus Anoxychlamydiales bacterium]
MNQNNLDTGCQNTWCLGCGNFSILNAIKDVVKSLVEDGTLLEDIVLVSGIGCHGKIIDYLDMNSFYSLHGRAVPAAEGIKIANPKLKVIVFSGDGDSYGEGLEHLIFAAKRNIDITMIVHNNRVYGLTTGQYTPTSPFGYKGKSTPKGTHEDPLNPLELMLASGATFISRAASHGINLLKKILKEAILHKGFSLVDILQVCVTYYNMYKYYSERVYELSDHDFSDYNTASNKIREWDYNKDAKIGLGVFYKKEKPTFDERYKDFVRKDIDRDKEINKILEHYI